VPLTVIHLKGSLDTAAYHQLQSHSRKAYESGMRNLLLDMREVTYISSGGLRALMDLLKLMSSDLSAESREAMLLQPNSAPFKSSHFKLLDPPDQVRKVLTMAGIDIFLDIQDNYEEAVASF
jgi:anti-anti-sigma factor